MDQGDADQDGTGDACDACIGVDRDGVCDDIDNCPNVANLDQADSNGNGVGDACETAPPAAGRMTGGGSIVAGGRVTYGFELHCDPSALPNNLQVNWGRGNRFHLTVVAAASCVDSPAIEPTPPLAGFDSYIGTGTGTYNGAAGATIEWRFTDAGEPGRNDTATILIKDASGATVLSVSGTLNGNHQAHSN